MNHISDHLDSTYLKTPEQANVSEKENTEILENLIQEAIENNIKAVMVLPNVIELVKRNRNGSKPIIGTVIDFPLGDSSLDKKLKQAKKAIESGAEELDFVINYNAWIQGKQDFVVAEIESCNKLILENNKTIKWIIETAALNEIEIRTLCVLIRDITQNRFPNQVNQVFVKSSTGFYPTEQNGATLKNIAIMVKESLPLPVKASGGIRDYKTAIQYLELGVKRIGTSSALTIIKEAN